MIQILITIKEDDDKKGITLHQQGRHCDTGASKAEIKAGDIIAHAVHKAFDTIKVGGYTHEYVVQPYTRFSSIVDEADD